MPVIGHHRSVSPPQLSAVQTDVLFSGFDILRIAIYCNGRDPRSSVSLLPLLISKSDGHCPSLGITVPGLTSLPQSLSPPNIPLDTLQMSLLPVETSLVSESLTLVQFSSTFTYVRLQRLARLNLRVEMDTRISGHSEHDRGLRPDEHWQASWGNRAKVCTSVSFTLT